MKKYTTILLMLVFYISITACKKGSSSGTSSSTHTFTYKLINKTDSALNINLYATVEDYMNNTNIVFSGKVGAKDTLLTTLQEDSSYYIDSYSDSYDYTNWVYENYIDTIGGGSGITLRHVSPSNDSAILSLAFSGDTRAVLINNNQPKTTWKIVDAYYYSSGSCTSIWSSLPTIQKNMSVIFHKNFSVDFVDTAGNPQHGTFRAYSVTGQFEADLRINDSIHTGMFMNGYIQPLPHHSQDSLFFVYLTPSWPTEGTRYLFVKQ